jgi:hypothetical protein
MRSIPGPPRTLGAKQSIAVSTHPPWVRCQPQSYWPTRVVDRQPAIAAAMRQQNINSSRKAARRAPSPPVNR